MSNSIGSLLALAVTTSIALANGGEGERKANPYQSGTVSWKPGSGIVLADSDEFALKLANQLQVQWSFAANDNAGDTNSFTVRRARTALTGHAFGRDLMYRLQLEAVDDGAGGNGALKDGWVQWAFSKNDDSTIGLRVGQGKTQHGLEATGSSTGLFFVERSTATRTFADVRSRGAWVHGSHNENQVRWAAGVQNGDVSTAAVAAGLDGGEEAANGDNELTWVGTVSFDPMGDITGGKGNESYKQGDVDLTAEELKGTVGAGVMFSNSNVGTDIESTQININTAWMFGGGLCAQGEIFLRTDDATGGDADTSGWYAQGMYVMPKSGDSPIQWGFGARLNMIDIDATAAALGIVGTGLGAGVPGAVTELSLVADALYHGHACKTQIEYTWQDTDPDGAVTSSTNHIIRVQFQLLF
ncbi:MAG: porin [Planctomycetota bacterium]